MLETQVQILYQVKQVSISLNCSAWVSVSLTHSTPWTSILVHRQSCLGASTVVCISLLLNRFKVLFGSLYPLIRWWLSIFATCFDGLPLCFCVRNHEFFALASARPWWYTAEQATEFIMNYDSDENDYNVASFMLCSVFYCLCVVCCVCVVYCFFFMSIISLHVVKIFLTQLHNHNFSVLPTKRKQTLHSCRTNISTLLCESFMPLY